MIRIVTFTLSIALLVFFWSGGASLKTDTINVPILVYHRFGPTVTDSMTVTTKEFESQVQWLLNNGHTIISLQSLVDYLRGLAPPPPQGTVVITVDDGHKSVYQELLPVIRKYHFPVTLFIYPSAISNASYALTWEELLELQNTNLVDIQSHTFWHPNFNEEQRKLSTADYSKLVMMQLQKSRSVLERQLAVRVDMLAWPFGIHDDWLEEKARQAGYVAAFTIERHHVNASEELLSLPRYLMVSGHDIQKIVGNAHLP